MSSISPVSSAQSAISHGVEAQKPADHSKAIDGLKAMIGQLKEQLGVGNKKEGANGQQSEAIPANETREAQQIREAKGHELARNEQEKREAEGHKKARQEQQEREAKEHGEPAPGASDSAAAADSSSQHRSSQSDALPEAGGKADPLSGSSKFEGSVAKLASAQTPSSVDPGYSNVSGGANTKGMVTKGTHELRPVPQNGGELSEAPTTLADINAVIKDIDPSLLTDPSQKGEGKLKDLPYGKMFEAAGKATGIDPVLLYADAQVETGDNLHSRVLVPNNINPIQTAPGVWPTTANAATNLFTGAFVMKDYINRADGDLKRGLNAYNTGNLDPSEKGFAHGYAGYYEGVMSAYANVQKAIKDPSIIEPGQGGNVSIESQI
ncbi:MAG: hypothetical protein V4695_12320 [Pseudomonadota bacterium]